MTEDNIAIRLKLLIEKLGISSSQFADQCKIPRPTFSQILNGRNKKVSDQLIRQVHSAYPNLSVVWLLFNEGNMWLGQPPGGASQSGGSADAFNNAVGSGGVPGRGVMPDDTSNPSREGEIDGENASEIPDFPTAGGNAAGDAKENGLNSGDCCSEGALKKEVKGYLKSAEIISELAKIRPKQRKVVSVTIYYDDSTFESFFPGN